MKSLFLLFILLISQTSFAASDCNHLAGDWRISDGSGTVIAIYPDCRAEFNKISPKHQNDSLTLTSLFYEGTQLRAQYGLKPGSVYEDGSPIQFPLPEAALKTLQGNVFLNVGGSLTFRIDLIDDECSQDGADPIKTCPAPPFIRI